MRRSVVKIDGVELCEFHHRQFVSGELVSESSLTSSDEVTSRRNTEIKLRQSHDHNRKISSATETIEPKNDRLV
jgi:hypothetical protein